MTIPTEYQDELRRVDRISAVLRSSARTLAIGSVRAGERAGFIEFVVHTTLTDKISLRSATELREIGQQENRVFVLSAAPEYDAERDCWLVAVPPA